MSAAHTPMTREAKRAFPDPTLGPLQSRLDLDQES